MSFQNFGNSKRDTDEGSRVFGFSFVVDPLCFIFVSFEAVTSGLLAHSLTPLLFLILSLVLLGATQQPTPLTSEHHLFHRLCGDEAHAPAGQPRLTVLGFCWLPGVTQQPHYTLRAEITPKGYEPRYS